MPELLPRARRPVWSCLAALLAIIAAAAPVGAVPVPVPVIPVPAGADSAIVAKQAEAERIAEALEAQHDRVSVLAEDFNVARLEATRLAGEATAAREQMVRTDADLAVVTDRFKQRLVAAYASGGGRPPTLALLVGAPVDEMAVRRTYIEVVAGQERLDIEGLQLAREESDRRRREMETAEQAADALTAQVEQRRAAAAKAVAAEQVTLARVNGELASLVAAEQTRRAEQEAARVKAELESRLAKERTVRLARESAATTTTTTTTPTTTSRVTVGATTATRATPTARPTSSSSTPTTGPADDEPPDDTAVEGPATTIPSASRPPPAGAAVAIAEAKRQLGKPYEWGSPGPDSFDCSGLTSWAWRAGGKSLPHSSRAQMAATTRIPVDQIEPGDLVFYGSPIGHVGLYAGDGQMVEASQTGTPVRMASIYRRDLVGVGRVK